MRRDEHYKLCVLISQSTIVTTSPGYLALFLSFHLPPDWARCAFQSSIRSTVTLQTDSNIGTRTTSGIIHASTSNK